MAVSVAERAAADAPDTMTSSADVVVLGGGPAGLSTALFAARKGLSVTLLERAGHVGGLTASFEVAGLRVDHGSHRLHPGIAPDVRRELATLLGDALQVRPRNGRIRLGGRWLAFPLRPGDLVRHAPLALSAGAARDLVTGPLRRWLVRGRPDTFAARARAGLGPAITSAFYEPYAHKIWGVGGDELSGDLYRRRVAAGSGSKLLRRLTPRGAAAKRTFLYPARGFGQIADALAEAAVDAGADVRLGEGADALAVDEHGATVRTAAGRELRARTVVSTLPARTTVDLAGETVPTEVRAAVGRLQHRGALLVYLVLDQPRYTPFDAHYFPEAGLPMARLSEPKNYRSSPDDPAGRTVLCAEVPASVGDERWTSSDVDLVGAVTAALPAAGLPAVRPVSGEVRRLPFVYPVELLGSDADQAVFETWAGAQPALLVLGRQALFAHDNTHHGLEMGRAAASCLAADGCLDRAAWEPLRAAFRDHVVED